MLGSVRWPNEAEWVATSATSLRLELNLDGLGNPPAGTHGPTSYSVVEPAPLSPADFDGDTDVDGNDLGFITASYGSDAGGDTDMDGDTDGADLLFWQREFTGPSELNVLATVPEPSSIGLAMLGAILLGTLHRSQIAFPPIAAKLADVACDSSQLLAVEKIPPPEQTKGHL